VKRIIVTSTVGAIFNTVNEPNMIFDETHWADEPVGVVKEQGAMASAMFKYRASKILAEKGVAYCHIVALSADNCLAAWEFYEEYKSQIPWDLVVLNPPLVINHL
jgi:nucleoside-diphosphate-sugar epimerase